MPNIGFPKYCQETLQLCNFQAGSGLPATPLNPCMHFLIQLVLIVKECLILVFIGIAKKHYSFAIFQRGPDSLPPTPPLDSCLYSPITCNLIQLVLIVKECYASTPLGFLEFPQLSSYYFLD